MIYVNYCYQYFDAWLILQGLVGTVGRRKSKKFLYLVKENIREPNNLYVFKIKTPLLYAPVSIEFLIASIFKA